MLTIDLTNDSALAGLQEVLRRAENLRPVLKEIGEDQVEAIKGRFVTATAPDGTPWAPNRPVTLERYAGIFGQGDRKKDGSLNKRGATRLANKKPLTGESGSLGKTINYRVGDTTVTLGSPEVYANVQHYGGKRSEPRLRHLWGDIPARPFMGVSDTEREHIVDLVRTYLLEG